MKRKWLVGQFEAFKIPASANILFVDARTVDLGAFVNIELPEGDPFKKAWIIAVHPVDDQTLED